MDDLDYLSEQQENVLAIAISNRKQFTGISLTHCIECGEEIEEKRRKVLAGVKTCVDCASKLERLNKRV